MSVSVTDGYALILDDSSHLWYNIYDIIQVKLLKGAYVESNKNEQKINL